MFKCIFLNLCFILLAIIEYLLYAERNTGALPTENSKVLEKAI